MNKSSQVKVHRDSQKGTQEITGKVYQGIIPSPEMMKEYQEIDATLPMRLVKAMEDEAMHRRQVEIRIIKNGFLTTNFNTVVGFFALIALAGLSYLFMNKGYPVQGAIIATSIGGVISVFVIGKAISNKKKDKSE
jgi:uncharacterized membrane protein